VSEIDSAFIIKIAIPSTSFRTSPPPATIIFFSYIRQKPFLIGSLFHNRDEDNLAAVINSARIFSPGEDIMDVPEHMPLADLKKAIKDFKMNATPKLSSKKADLMQYAVKVGILKAKAAPEAPEVAEVKEVKAKKVVELPVVLKAKAAKEELPDVLKAPKEPKAKAKAAKAEAAPVAPAKKTSPFAAFMAAHKGKGFSMAQLAEMYKKGK
jgi:hypothetical protein